MGDSHWEFKRNTFLKEFKLFYFKATEGAEVLAKKEQILLENVEIAKSFEENFFIDGMKEAKKKRNSNFDLDIIFRNYLEKFK